MTGAIGKNTPSGEILRSFVERIEHVDEEKKALNENRKAIFAEAKAAGFNTGAINYLIKVRKMKPHDRQEAEALRDVYLHAMGMDNEPPLFRQMGAIARDIAGDEKLLEVFKLLVPQNGYVIFKVGDRPLRLSRGKDGEPVVEPYTDPGLVENVTRGAAAAARPKRDVPDCTPDEAEQMGEVAAKENVAVIDNPFPFGDQRRPRWDEGWRRGAGSNGMGG